MSMSQKSIFQTKLDEEIVLNPASKYSQIVNKLGELEDGSKEHFLEALKDGGISSPAIAKTLKETTGVVVCRSTINEWRRKFRSKK